MSKQLTGVIKSKIHNCSKTVMCEEVRRICHYGNKDAVNVP